MADKDRYLYLLGILPNIHRTAAVVLLLLVLLAALLFASILSGVLH